MKNIAKITFLTAILSTSFLLSACNQAKAPSPTTKKPNSTQNAIDDKVPTLTSNINGQTDQFKLRSQISRYLNEEKSSAEFLISNSVKLSCQMPSPKLATGEQIIKITINNKDKSAVKRQEFKSGTDQEMSAEILNSDGTSVKFQGGDTASAVITDINSSIIRGNMRIKNENLSLQGDFFTAICK